MNSVRFNATTSDIDFGVQAAQTPTAQTVLALCYPITSGENTVGHLLARSNASAQGMRFYVDDNAAAPSIAFGAHSSGTSTAPVRLGPANAVILKQWQHLAATWDGGLAATGIKLFQGQKGLQLAEVASYLVSTNGTGTINNGSAETLHVGNRVSTAVTFDGDIAYVAQWNRVLELTELRQAQRFGPRAVPGGLVLYWDGKRDLGPYSLKPLVIDLAPGFQIPVQFNPVPTRPIYYRVKAPAAAGVFIKLVGDNFRLAGSGGLAG